MSNISMSQKYRSLNNERLKLQNDLSSQARIIMIVKNTPRYSIEKKKYENMLQKYKLIEKKMELQMKKDLKEKTGRKF